MLARIKNLSLTAILLSLVASNVLTLTNTAFNTSLSSMISTYLGVRTVTGALQTKLASKNAIIRAGDADRVKRKAATRRFGTRLASRTKRVVGKSIAAIPAESVPFLGVAVLIADTGYEIYAACETMRDLDELYSQIGLSNETPDEALQAACNPELPDADAVWEDVVATSEQWLEDAREALRQSNRRP